MKNITYWSYKRKARKDLKYSTDYINLHALVIYERNISKEEERCIWKDGKYDANFVDWEHYDIKDEQRENQDFYVNELTSEEVEELLFVEEL